MKQKAQGFTMYADRRGAATGLGGVPLPVYPLPVANEKQWAVAVVSWWNGIPVEILENTEQIVHKITSKRGC